jgi:hypothetical protein
MKSKYFFYLGRLNGRKRELVSPLAEGCWMLKQIRIMGSNSNNNNVLNLLLYRAFSIDNGLFHKSKALLIPTENM